MRIGRELCYFARMREFIVFCLVSLSACSSSTSTTGSSAPTGTGSLTGTIGGSPFTFVSGLAHTANDGTLDLILSNAAGVCDARKSNKVHAGETLVQIYNLKGSAPGAFTPANNDIKYARVKSSCPSGQSVEQNVDTSSRVATSDITVSRLTDAEVEGNLKLTFADGSSLSGTFKLPLCTYPNVEGGSCY